MLLHIDEHSSEPLRSQIARQVRHKILLGDLGEGAPLPAPRTLARSHRVSPACVRQAYEELAREGWVEQRGGAGLRVALPSAGQRRELARQMLLEDLRRQELSLRELELARDIQRRLLPPAKVEGDGFSVVARSFPARFVAGDFYDVLRYADGSLGVVVADVAGKGFGASLIMASVKAMMPFIAAEHSVTGTLRELNRRLCRDLGRREFVALAYARFEPARGRLLLANAGAPDPFLLHPGQGPRPIEAGGPRLPLGVRPEVGYTAIECALAPGDAVLMFTDGIPEARSASGEPLGYDTFAEILTDRPRWDRGSRAMEIWLDEVLEGIQRATGPAPDDDWTAVALECLAPRASSGSKGRRR